MRLKRFGQYIIFSPDFLNKNCMQCGRLGKLGKDACSHLKCLACLQAYRLSECVQCHRDQEDSSFCQVIKVIEKSKSLSRKPQIGMQERTRQNKVPTTIIGKETGKKYFPAVKKISTGTGTYFEAPKNRFDSVSALQILRQMQAERNFTDDKLPPPAFPSSSVVQPVKAQVQKKNHGGMMMMMKSVKPSGPLFVGKLNADLPPSKVLKRKRFGTVSNTLVKTKVYRPLLKCRYCARGFAFQSWLKRHMAKHTGTDVE